MRDENRGMGVDAYEQRTFCWGPDGNLAQLNLLHRRRANECDSALALLRAHASEAIRSKFKKTERGTVSQKNLFVTTKRYSSRIPWDSNKSKTETKMTCLRSLVSFDSTARYSGGHMNGAGRHGRQQESTSGLSRNGLPTITLENIIGGDSQYWPLNDRCNNHDIDSSTEEENGAGIGASIFR
eukprot:scaffold686_cov245-Skeletonema_marinoi.AAC.9